MQKQTFKGEKIMSEIKDIELAKATFQTLCCALDKNEWSYKKDEEKMSIECGAQGDDLPIEITINIDADRMVAIMISKLPFVIEEEKRLDVVVAVSAVNNILVDGCFDFDIASGHMFFRMTNSFIDSKISEEVFSYLLFCSCQAIDEYNDRFLMIGKGIVSIEQFLTSLSD